MGFFENFVKNPVATVSNTVNRELSNAGNTVNENLDNASRGDIGKYTAQAVNTSINVVKAPVEVAYYAARGENTKAKESVYKGLGAQINSQGVVTDIYNPNRVIMNLSQTEGGQKFLNSDQNQKYTLGLSSDFAGYAHGAKTLEGSGYISNSDINSSLRLGSKAAAITAGIYYAPQFSGAIQRSSTALYNSVVQNPGTSLVFGKYLAEGKSSQALQYLAGKGAFDDLKEYLPDLPTIPSEYSDFLNSLIPKSKVPSYLSGSTGTQVNDPWSWSGIADSGLSSTNSNKIYYYIFGATLLAFFVYKGLKK